MTNQLTRWILALGISISILHAEPALANCTKLSKQAKVLAEDLHEVETNILENTQSINTLEESPVDVIDDTLEVEASLESTVSTAAAPAVELDTLRSQRKSLQKKRELVINKISKVGEELKRDCSS